jgi:uroporphyrinogen-III decarboxylase
METCLSSKERMFKALRGQKPDALPAAPAYLILFLADFERAYYIEQYRLRMRGRNRYSVDHQEDVKLRAQAIYQSYGIFKAQPDWMQIRIGPGRGWAERTDIVSKDGVLYYQDIVSGNSLPMNTTPLPLGDAELVPKARAQHDVWDKSQEIQSKEQVDECLLMTGKEELTATGAFDLPRQVMTDCGDRYFITTIMETPYSAAYNILGFMGMMMIQQKRPDLFHHILARQLACTQNVMAAWADVGIHGVWVEEMFSGADIISPSSYDEFVFAYNQPYFVHMSQLDLLPIHYVPGDAMPRLDRISQLEIAAVAVEDSKKNFVIEIEEVVRQVDGRVAVLGNIDAVRFGPGATLDDMANEVKRQARIGARTKGFVISTGSPFPLDTNPRLIDTMVATAHISSS